MSLRDNVEAFSQILQDDLRKPIACELIDPDPNNDRLDWHTKQAAADFAEICESIRANGGNHQDILVTNKADGRYMIIAGERRWRACSEVGLETVNAIIKHQLNEREIWRIRYEENHHRRSLSPIERALALQRRKDKLKLSTDELAKELNIPERRAYETLSILSMDEGIVSAMKKHFIRDIRMLTDLEACKKTNPDAFAEAIRLLQDDLLTRYKLKQLLSQKTGVEKSAKNFTISANVAHALYQRARRLKQYDHTPDSKIFIDEFKAYCHKLDDSS